MIGFELLKTSSTGNARLGQITTANGIINTPVFMPVGTQATVKHVSHKILTELDAQIILGNTFHLYLRPGNKLIAQAGGIHNFMNWDKPVLTDSGGYQVYSLSEMRKISEEGVSFRSPVDGSKHFFSPEEATRIQQDIGADIIMAFDECTPYPCAFEYAEQSMKLTHRWLDRCMGYLKNGSGASQNQIFIPIVQGSTYTDLRKESALYVASKECPINAIGGLSVGEPAPIMYEMTENVTAYLPENKGRYLMGVGTPQNILECIDRGVDMFDCVLPTRNARHGHLYTKEGVINIKNAKWKNDFSPIDPDSTSDMSRNYSKAYLRHLFSVNEALGYQIASIHNLAFYLWLTSQARNQILQDRFKSWKGGIVDRLGQRL